MTDADEGRTIDNAQPPSGGALPRRRPSALALSVAVAVLAVVVSFAAVALASGGAVTVGSASNSELGKKVVVNPQGRTLYALSPETSHHLLCTSRECLKAWPPLTVPSRRTKLKAGSGVQGLLSLVRRSDGRLQVALRGRPLYRFSGDHSRGEANGEGVESFGGTWHAVTAATKAPATTPKAPSPTPTTPTTPTTEATPGYGY